MTLQKGKCVTMQTKTILKLKMHTRMQIKTKAHYFFLYNSSVREDFKTKIIG